MGPAAARHCARGRRRSARAHRPGTDPTFFRSYLGQERSWPRHIGDRVRQDADGFFYFEGRLDEAIIASGYRIGPDEVEEILPAIPRSRKWPSSGTPTTSVVRSSEP
jgi:acyl-coenzyme A synthetase/AMP-(fatty) acid ligase